MFSNCRKLKTIAASIFAAVAAMFLWLYLERQNTDDVWDVLIQGLPTRVAPEYASHNVALYILRQTHEPLFRINSETGQFDSRIFNTWQRSVDGRSLEMCPNEALEFAKGQLFSTAYLQDFLAKVLGRKYSRDSFSIRVVGHCVTAAFAERDTELLYFLSRYEQSPTAASKDSRLEIGLGPYVATGRTESEIVLDRKVHVRNGYNKIILHQWLGSNDPLMNDHKVEDFNRISSGDIPQWVKQDYANYGVNLLNTVILVINHPDVAIRRIIYNCADVAELRKSFYLSQKSFFDVATVTPVGLPASKPGLPQTNCITASGSLVGKQLTMLNYKASTEREMDSWAEKFNKRSGLNLTVSSIATQRFIDGGLKRPHLGDLYIMSLDTPYAAYDDFFTGFVFPDEKVTLTDVDVPSLGSAYEMLRNAKNSFDRDGIARRMNDILQSEAIALPLFQVVRPFYYPKNVESLKLGTNFLEYPEIGELRL